MPLILPGNVATATAAVGYTVANSVRLDGNAYMHKTQSGGNRQIFTMSCWTKLTGGYGASGGSLLSTDGTDDDSNFHFTVKADKLTLHIYGADAFTTAPVLRDYSAWYHIVLAVDTTQSTSSNRMKLYVNNSQITLTEAGDYPDQNDNFGVNESGTVMAVGTHPATNSIAGYALNSYLAEYCLIDGQQLTPSSFGEANSDSPTIWQPIDPSDLTFGTNGFYLDFEASGNLGNDVNGGTDLTEVSLAATDQSTDTPTNNFCTMNPLAYRLESSGITNPTYSEGNCKLVLADDTYGKSSMGTIGVTTGKWYWEMKLTTDNDAAYCGITRAEYDPNDNFGGESIYYNSGDGALSVGTGTGGTADGSYGDTYTTGDIIGVAFDATNGVIWFSKAGTWQNSATIAEIGAGTTTNAATTGITMSQTWMPFLEGNNCTWEVNLGGSPAFTVDSANADGDSYGSFEFPVPSGYFALCTKNLAEYG